MIFTAPLIKSLNNYGTHASKTLINMPCILKESILTENIIKSVPINEGIPFFTDPFLKSTHPFFIMSNLDSLGRTHQAATLITPDTLSTCKRCCNLSKFNPSAWMSQKIGKAFLFHRCHLIGYQFWGNATNQLNNLITGCRYFNVAAMKSVEMQIVKHIKLSQSACLYRVTPVYLSDNLLPHGVLMEAVDIYEHSFSVCTYIPNVQPGYCIDYNNGGLCE